MVPDRMKMPSVGVCEWTVTMVKEHKISEHAKLKGNTQVICRFNEEAERHCKSASVSDWRGGWFVGCVTGGGGGEARPIRLLGVCQ
jgi:hypothetical protein